MWQEMTADSANFAVECQTAILEAEGRYAEVATPAEDLPVGRFGEDKTVQATVRIGQSFFRDAVLGAYEERCCITGLSIPALLVASHIVPWRTDKGNRLNPKNGLALSALHDRAFDSGLITINDDLTVRVSKHHTHSEDVFFRAAIALYEGKPIRKPSKFGIGEEFLAYHREHIFLN